MITFEKIKLSGFRRLHEVELELRPLMVMIGANGIGKTSFLDAWSLLAASARGNLNSKLAEYGGLPSLLTYGRAEKLAFELSMPWQGDARFDYALDLVPRGLSYLIESENLTLYRGQPNDAFFGPRKCIVSHGADIMYYHNDIKKPNWDFNHLETAVSQAPKMFEGPEKFRQRLASFTQYHTLDVRPRAPVRLPQPMRPASFPGENGEDLISCLFSLRETDRDRFETIEDTLRVAFPGFERLDFPPVAAGTLYLTWKDKYFPKPIYLDQISEGMLRFLWLITLLQSPELTAVTMIDEPEVSLHPELLSLLVDLMREASLRTQLIVATHSDRLVSFLKPEEVVVLDLTEQGLATLTWADKLDLERWLQDYSLGEIWAGVGQMGGRS
jgi:predicted ATPase